MDSIGLNPGNFPPPERAAAKKQQADPVVKDRYTQGDRSSLSAVTSHTVAGQLFSSRQIEWSTTWKKDAGVSKGLLEAPDGDLLAGTYCDLTRISTKDGTKVWENNLMENGRMRNLSTSPMVQAKDGSYLIGTTDGTLYSLDSKTGKELWSYKTDSYDTTPLQAHDGTIFVQKGKDIALLNPDGTEKLQVPLGIEKLRISCVDGKGTLYAEAGDRIHTIGIDGKKGWEAAGKHITAFADDPGHLYCIGDKSVPHPEHKNPTTFHTLVSSLDPATGKKLWEKEYDYATVSGFHKDKVFIYEHDKVSALDPATGDLQWESPGQWMRRLNTILDDGTVILTGPNSIEALDGATGVKKWDLPIKAHALDSPARRTSDGTIIIADENNIYNLDSSKGTIQYSFHLDKGIHRIIPSRDERVVYAEESETGVVHAVDFRKATVIAKDLAEGNEPPPSGNGDMTVDDDYITIDDIKIPVNKSQYRLYTIRPQKH
jgi:outer membrane protein assembly factor BamB